jgi:alkanesulfonate monooxygenase SsuD/methylene tetrahydromethanopterin reductase-like flavin-dependent oxidoreductase (luciferase family)
MRILAFHLMPYADLDLNYQEKYQAAWVVLPNSYFDRKKGHALYSRYLDELEYADSIGFDGVCVNEHHQNAYGIMPQPSVTAGALSRRTKGWLAVLGRALPLLANPSFVAEEYAMLDQITGGRLIAGFVRGIGSEYHSTGVNPTESLERFHEAHELIIRAWTEDKPFNFQGKYYNFEYVNVWPRTYQDPHPPVFIPSQGSIETIRWAAAPERKYTYLQTYSPREVVVKCMEMYKATAREFGYESTPDQLGWSVPVYCAPTDEQAIAEAKPHAEAFINKFLAKPIELTLPPGYVSMNSLKGAMAVRKMRAKDQSFEKMLENGSFIAGSPKTVREKLLQAVQQLGIGNLLMTIQFGTMPHDQTMRSIELLGTQVIPYLKEHVGASTPTPATVA